MCRYYHSKPLSPAEGQLPLLALSRYRKAEICVPQHDEIDLDSYRVPPACSGKPSSQPRCSEFVNTAAPLINAVPPAWSKQDFCAALAAGAFIPYFQPQFDLQTLGIRGVEVLARWDHPRYGLLPPLHFLEQMEEHGLLGRLFDTILDGALTSTASWGTQNDSCTVSVNIAPSTLLEDDIVQRIRMAIMSRKIAPERIVIELTESARPADAAQMERTLEEIRGLGLRLSIDDFGTGYSGLKQLDQISFNELKIDKSLVVGSIQRTRSLPILEVIMDLAKRLHMTTVAEGIADDRECALLRDLGCELGQSYYLAEPMPHDHFVAYLTYGWSAACAANAATASCFEPTHLCPSFA
jgi:EAL domain-containing protein (putative c-di-GMP-specific phosphodiesterase class I)